MSCGPIANTFRREDINPMKPLLYPNHPKTLRSFIFESRGCRPDGMPPGTRRVLSSTPAQSSLPCSPGSLPDAVSLRSTHLNPLGAAILN